ncbi:hypothetical protein Syun_016522 [Stephania yunnanensis]|uniref:Uncharacterized protein n=1 Tax=Stephania yunnanensis TaxID=152371 RepID=A0AAP0J6V2_9MAGN
MQSSRNQTIKKIQNRNPRNQKQNSHRESPASRRPSWGVAEARPGFVELELQFLVRHFSESPQTLQNPIDHELDFRLHASSKKP